MVNKLLSTRTQVLIIGQFLTHLRAKLKSTKVKQVEVCSRQQKVYAQVGILIEQQDQENMKKRKSLKKAIILIIFEMTAFMFRRVLFVEKQSSV